MLARRRANRQGPGPGPGPDPQRPNICLHFITFGNSRGQPRIPMPVISNLDLSPARGPPSPLCRRYTDVSPEIAAAFFSIPGHEANYRDSLQLLDDRLEDMLSDPRPRRSVCAAVLVNCATRMHRSVAMVERLADDVERLEWWRDGVCVVVEHLDTDVERGVRRAQRARAGDRGRAFSRGMCECCSGGS